MLWLRSAAQLCARVRLVLPGSLTGFFAAVVVGSILSTFNSVLNSSATLFSLGVYKTAIHPSATPQEVVKSGRICSIVVTIICVLPCVMMVREIVPVIAESRTSGTEALRILRKFSRIRSATTTDSFTE